jgi:hypothetical protein
MVETEADYFGNCPVCGALLDTRDLGPMLAHVHDAEIARRGAAAARSSLQ